MESYADDGQAIGVVTGDERCAHRCEYPLAGRTRQAAGHARRVARLACGNLDSRVGESLLVGGRWTAERSAKGLRSQQNRDNGKGGPTKAASPIRPPASRAVPRAFTRVIV
jgi:hypothetical protein